MGCSLIHEAVSAATHYHTRVWQTLIHGKECYIIIIRPFFFRKKGYINFVSSGSVVCPSVRAYVRPYVTFLENVSPPKPLEVATSNFVGE